MAEGNSSKNDEDLKELESCSNGVISHTVGIEKSGKRERIGVANESENFSKISENSGDSYAENSKKIKREGQLDSLFSPSAHSKNKRHQRNYRPRVMDSSSEDESDNLASNLNDNNHKNIDESANSSDKNKSDNSNNIHNGNNVVKDAVLEGQVQDSSTLNSDSNTSRENRNSTNVGDNFGNNDNTNESSTSSSSQDERHQESVAPASTTSMEANESVPPNSSSTNETPRTSALSSRRVRRFFSSFPFDSDSDDESLDEDESEDNEDGEEGTPAEDKAKQRATRQERIIKDVDDIMGKAKPNHQWNSLQALWDRQYGMPGNRQSATLFKNRFYDSLHVAKRLDLTSKLEFHNGCVNALNFDDSGELLASSSDDLQVAIWDWKREQTRITYNSGHRNNVFQCKFLPLSGHTYIVSCARDGQVRLAELTSSGVCRDTRRIAKHSRSAHKLTTRTSAPYEVMSAGEDAFVYNIDIRNDHPDKVVLVKDVRGNRVPLYSIHQHPINDDQFCVSGQDEYVRVYDRRIVSPFGPPVIKYCPNHLVDKKFKANVTCAVYSNNGDAILASYNDEDIYLFDTSLSEGAQPAHRYSGHRNSSTVKGVNFFSPSSKYVVSGSDCGNIFIWERESEAIVNFMLGDDNGVVNVLEPHPHLPILTTSGLDNEVKIWVPSAYGERELNDLNKTVRSNVLKRSRADSSDPLDTQVLMMMFQHMRRNPARGRRSAAATMDDDDDLGMLDSSSDSSSDDNDSDNDSDSNNHGDLVQCSTH